jgi:GntR family transcriptional regulator
MDPLDNVPLAERARTAILEAILSERFVDRLPPEDELAGMLGVSRTTIRSALQSLEQGGVVTRRRALGTMINKHVAPSRLALQRMLGYDRLVQEVGGTVRVDLSWERSTTPPDFVKAFGIDPDAEHLVTDKSYYSDGSLLIHIRDSVPWEDLRTEPTDSLTPSLFEFSREYLKDAIDHAVAEIVPAVNGGSGMTQLDLKKGAGFIRLHQRSYSRNGDALAYSITDVDDRYIRFEVFRR